MANSPLTILRGRAGTGKTHWCFTKIREILEAEGLRGTGTPTSIILLVPEPSTYRIERALAEYMAQEGFHSVHVVGFSRLGYKVQQSVGVQRERGLSNTGHTLLLRSILKKTESDLTIFRQIAQQPHFANVVQGLIQECHAFDVTPSDLRRGAAMVISPLLQHKLEDLALVSEAYERTLLEQVGTTANDMDRLIANIPHSPITKGAHVFIDGFHWFTGQQQRLVEMLIDHAASAYVTITAPTQRQGFAREGKRGALFYRPWTTCMTLLERYPDAQVVEFSDMQRNVTDGVPGPVAILERGYFASSVQRRETANDIPVHVAYNAKREVESICAQIWAYMQSDEGWRWRDFAIMLRDETTYGDLLEKTLAEYEIPYFTDQRHPMLSHPLAELVEGLFDLVRSQFGHDALFRILKTDLFPLAREAVDALENYCLAYGKTGFRWLSLEDWTQGQEAMPEWVDAVNATRTVVQEFLLPWYQMATHTHTGAEWCQALYALLERLQVATQLQAWYEEALEVQDNQGASAHSQMYARLLDLLDEVSVACGSDCLTVEEMQLVFSEGLGELAYSLVPPTLDHVTVTTIERSYANAFPIVFVPGLSEGIFPQPMGEEGVLRDKEREQLRTQGILLGEGALAQAFNEPFLFYLACTRATQRLHLSYAMSSLDGAQQEASLWIRRLGQTGYTLPNRVVPLLIPSSQALTYFWRPQQSLRQLVRYGHYDVDALLALASWGFYHAQDRFLEAYRSRTMYMEDECRMTQVDSRIVEALLASKSGLAGSVTHFEMYNSCPFRYYAQYVLQAKPRKIQRFTAPERGTFLHAVLRQLGLGLLAEATAWHEVPEDTMAKRIDEAVRTIGEEYFGDTAYEQHLQHSLGEMVTSTVERLREWSARSQFRMSALEQSFGMYDPEGTSWPALSIQSDFGVPIRLRGQIDRIDLWRPEGTEQTYGLIIDYKTSKHTRITAQEVYYGLRLQLVTYLMALEEAKKQSIIPAGLVYTYMDRATLKESGPLTLEEAKELQATVKNSGYFDKHIDVLRGIDETVERGNSPYVPIGFKKTGDFTAASKSFLKSQTDFHILSAFTKKKLEYTGTSIMEGLFAVAPLVLDKKKPCAYCDFAALCHVDALEEKGQSCYHHRKKLSEEEAMVSMAEQVGIVRESETGEEADDAVDA